MPRARGTLQKRTPREWAFRAGIAFAIALVGYLCVTRSLSQVLRNRSPAFAHAIAPEDARTAARLALDTYLAKPTQLPNAPAVVLARQALASDAAAVSAVAVLMFQAELNRNDEQLRRLFAYSQRLSRRNLPIQIWAIENAVSQNDVKGALRYYDLALRTSRKAPNLLYPILTAALSEPDIRSGLAVTLAGKPRWGPDFVAYALANTKAPLEVASLLQILDQRGARVGPEVEASLVSRLVLFGAFEPAWRYYARLGRGTDRSRSRDATFKANVPNPAPFDWIVMNSAEVSAALQHDPRGGALQFSVPANGGGKVAEQVQLLPPGAYRLAGTSSGIDQDERSLPFWTVSCWDGRELARVAVPRSTASRGRFAAQFVVPGSCPIQRLTLIGRSSDQIGGTSGQIDSVGITPLR